MIQQKSRIALSLSACNARGIRKASVCSDDCFYICKEIVVMRLPCFDILIELAVTAQPLPFPAAANLDTANMLRVLFRAFQGPFVQS
jgi:hypothetical protein